MPDYVKFPLVMLVVTVVAASALAIVFDITDPRIKAQEARNEREGEKIVFPEGDRTVEREVNGLEYKEAYRGGELIGYIVKGESEGYSSTIEVLVGVARDFSLNGIKVLSQKETPGLGTKIVEVESTKTWGRILAGEESLWLTPEERKALPKFIKGILHDKDGKPRRLGIKDLRLTADGGSVDGITSATVSSRAVTDAVRCAIEALQRALGVSS